MTTNPLSEVGPWDLVADGYVDEVVPAFEKWALDSFDRVSPGPADRVLDAACGPGTVAMRVAPMVKRVTALDFSPAMIAKLTAAIARQRVTNITAAVCDCQRLPFADATFDLVFSQFGLMFFPNRQSGFDELFRVLSPGGRAAIYSWAPLSRSPAMTAMMGALHEAFPQTRPDPEDNRTIVSGLDDPSIFEKEMGTAGFTAVRIEPVAHDLPYPGAAPFFESMVRGSAPISLMKRNTAPAEWEQKSKVAVAWLRETVPEGTETLRSTAYLGTGIKA